MMRSALFRATRPLLAKDKYPSKATKSTFTKAPTTAPAGAGNNNMTTPTTPSTATTATPTGTTTATSTTTPPRTRSGIVYADGPTMRTPRGGPGPVPTPRVYDNSGTGAQAQKEMEQAAQESFWTPPKPPERIDAEDWLQTLNRVRVHPVYKFTRLFALGTSAYLISKRIRNAEYLPEEQYDPETAELQEKMQKEAAKAKRIAFATIQRVWSPWDSHDETTLPLLLIEPDEVVEEGKVGGEVAEGEKKKEEEGAVDVIVEVATAAGADTITNIQKEAQEVLPVANTELDKNSV